MDSERTVKTMAEQLEALTKENERLKQELSVLRQEKEKANPVSFKERYAVKILNSLPDMLTVFDHNEIGIEVVSNDQNIHSNMQHAVATGAVSAAHHELDFNGKRHYYENRIFPLDEKYVLIMCRDISERVATQRQLEVFKSVLDKVSDSILAVS